MNKPEPLYIVVDYEKGLPMSFADDQLCFVPRMWSLRSKRARVKFPLSLYTKKKALEAIRKSNLFRKSKGFSLTKYSLIPVSHE
jgi:hypothetical protein